MASFKITRLFTTWKYYLVFLWLFAIIFAGYIIYAYIAVNIAAEKNPAIGLAIVGIVAYAQVFILYCGFILANHYIKERITKNKKRSDIFLITSWILIGVIAAASAIILIYQAIIEDNYQKNILPKQQACYKEYLDGKRASPHCPGSEA